MEKMKGILKEKKFWLIIGALVLLGITYGIGNSGAKVSLGEEKVNHEELTSNIQELEDELENKESEVEEIKGLITEEGEKLEERKEEVDEVLALVDDKQSIEDEKTAIEKDLSKKESELEDLNESIESKEGELEKIENAITKKEEEPIELLSGVYIIGEDVPADRYQVTNIGRGTNFFVYGSSGSSKVNTILGEDNGSGDYVFFGNEGDVIETNGKVKLIPVE